MPTLLKIGCATYLIHPVMMATCKAGMRLFYLRVFIDKWMRYLIFATLALVIG